jgi:hypothetical protein
MTLNGLFMTALAFAGLYLGLNYGMEFALYLKSGGPHTGLVAVMGLIFAICLLFWVQVETWLYNRSRRR